MEIKKRPYNLIIDNALDIVKDDKENSKFLFEHSDNLIVWIVGFSIVAVGLLLSRSTPINNDIKSIFILKSINYSLLLTILFGFFFRISYYFRYMYDITLKGIVQSNLSHTDLYNVVGDIESLNTFAEIAYVYKKTLDIDFPSDTHSLFNTWNDDVKKTYLDSLKNQYNKYKCLVLKDKENAIDDIKSIYQDTYNLSDIAIENQLNGSKKTIQKKYKWASIINNISFWLCLISFVGSIALLAFAL